MVGDDNIPEILRAVAHKNRIQILQVLSINEAGLGPTGIIKELQGTARLSSPLVVKHLKTLEKVGLVKKYSPESSYGRPVWTVVGPERVRLVLDTARRIGELVASGASFKKVERSMMIFAFMRDNEKIRLKTDLKHLSDESVWQNLTERERRVIQSWNKLLEMMPPI